jgi:hypothetical protein
MDKAHAMEEEDTAVKLHRIHFSRIVLATIHYQAHAAWVSWREFCDEWEAKRNRVIKALSKIDGALTKLVPLALSHYIRRWMEVVRLEQQHEAQRIKAASVLAKLLWRYEKKRPGGLQVSFYWWKGAGDRWRMEVAEDRAHSTLKRTLLVMLGDKVNDWVVQQLRRRFEAWSDVVLETIEYQRNHRLLLKRIVSYAHHGARQNLRTAVHSWRSAMLLGTKTDKLHSIMQVLCVRRWILENERHMEKRVLIAFKTWQHFCMSSQFGAQGSTMQRRAFMTLRSAFVKCRRSQWSPLGVTIRRWRTVTVRLRSAEDAHVQRLKDKRHASKSLLRTLQRMIKSGLAKGFKGWKEGLEEAWKEQTALMLREMRDSHQRTALNGALGSLSILKALFTRWVMKKQGEAFKFLKRLIYYEKRLRKSIRSMYNTAVRGREESGKKHAMHTWSRHTATMALAAAHDAHKQAHNAQHLSAAEAKSTMLVKRVYNALVFSRARLFLASALVRWRSHLHSLHAMHSRRELALTRLKGAISTYIYGQNGVIGGAWAVLVRHVWEAQLAAARAEAAAEVAGEYGADGLSGRLSQQSQSAGAAIVGHMLVRAWSVGPFPSGRSARRALHAWSAATKALDPVRQGVRLLDRWQGAKKRQQLGRALWRWHDVVVEIGMRLYAEGRAAEHAATVEQVSLIRSQLEQLQQQRVAELAEQQTGHEGRLQQLDDDWRQRHAESAVSGATRALLAAYARRIQTTASMSFHRWRRLLQTTGPRSALVVSIRRLAHTKASAALARRFGMWRLEAQAIFLTEREKKLGHTATQQARRGLAQARLLRLQHLSLTVRAACAQCERRGLSQALCIWRDWRQETVRTTASVLMLMRRFIMLRLFTLQGVFARWLLRAAASRAAEARAHTRAKIRRFVRGIDRMQKQAAASRACQLLLQWERRSVLRALFRWEHSWRLWAQRLSSAERLAFLLGQQWSSMIR